MLTRSVYVHSLKLFTICVPGTLGKVQVEESNVHYVVRNNKLNLTYINIRKRHGDTSTSQVVLQEPQY